VDPLVDPSDARLGVAIEENLADLFRAMGRLPGAEIVEGPDLSLHHAFPVNPMFAGVWATRLAGDRVDAAIDDAIAWFSARDAPFAFWWSGPSTEPADLAQRLEARGFLSMQEQTATLASGIHAADRGSPGMAADLSAVHEDALAAVPDGFAIDRVRDERALLEFKRVFVETYGIPEFAGQAWVDATLGLGIEEAPWRLYVGRLDGEPVATSMLFNGGGVASVYAVATVDRTRGLGIGGAITLAPLLEARAEGYRHAVLFSTQMGVGAYRRIGFRPIDAWIDRHLWRRPD
jgi:GNAT superfamily N-acetyltransferase